MISKTLDKNLKAQSQESTKSVTKNDFKYNYIVQNPWNIRLINLFAFISYIGVVYGFVEYLRISIWYAIFFGPLILLVCFTHLGGYFINIFYPQFDISKHDDFVENFWKENEEPAVDIFLPIAGESIEIIENTWKGIRDLDYSNFSVFVLDDGASKEVLNLAEKYKFTYLSRSNRGEFKKSGNVQHGLDNSKGKFILILDADFRPIPEALKESIPYIESNEKISILQTPQYFDITDEIHNKNPIEYGAASLVEEFYRVIMPSRIVFGAGKCVGTSAIYRRKALADAGGMPKLDGSEDIRIGLATKLVGYYVQYIPLIISKGVCPDNIQSYFKQQSRWADGTVATFFSDLYFNNKLNIWTKFTYLNSFLYYFMGALTPLLSLQILALLYFNTDSIRLSWIVPFVPYLIYLYALKPVMQLSKFKHGTMLTGLTNMLAYSDAVVRLIFNKAQKWEAAGQSNVKRYSSDEFIISANLATLFTVFYIITFTIIIYLKPYVLLNIETWIVLIIALKRIVDFSRYCWYIQMFNRKKLDLDVSKNNIPMLPVILTQISTGFLAVSVLMFCLILGLRAVESIQSTFNNNNLSFSDKTVLADVLK